MINEQIRSKTVTKINRRTMLRMSAAAIVASTSSLALPQATFASCGSPEQAIADKARTRDDLGRPTTNIRGTPDGIGFFQHFERGAIYWHPSYCARVLHGAIWNKFSSVGWERKDGILGYPTTDETITPNQRGFYNHFEHGSVYWTEQTGAHFVRGAIRQKWANMGWENSFLGFPITDESLTPDNRGWYQHFEGGSLYSLKNVGTSAIGGAIRQKWASMGWENSYLGFPISDESSTADGRYRYNRFEGGYIYFSPETGAEATVGIRGLPARKRNTVMVDLYCEEQNENGDDEAYVLASNVFLPTGKAETPQEPVWQGDISDSDDRIERHYSSPFLVGNYALQPGEMVVITIRVSEQDGDNYADGIKFVGETAQKLAKRYGGINLDDIDVAEFTRITRSFWENSDDFTGAFLILLERNELGTLDADIYPLARARTVSGANGVLRLDGDGAEYYPSVYINGERLIYGHH